MNVTPGLRVHAHVATAEEARSLQDPHGLVISRPEVRVPVRGNVECKCGCERAGAGGDVGVGVM